MKKYIMLIGIFILAVLLFYWSDTVRIQRNVHQAVADSLNQSLKSEIGLQPTVLVTELPAKDSSNLYITIHDENTNDSYRVLNVEDYWVQRQIETTTRGLFDENKSAPVAKITGFSVRFVPAISVSVYANVQYVDPFGIIRSTRVNVNAQLKRLPVLS